MLSEDVSRLIGRIYESGGNVEGLRAVLEDMLKAVKTRCVVLSALDLREKRMITDCWVGPPQESGFWDGVHEYRSEMQQFDPLIAYAAAVPNGGIVSSNAALDYLAKRSDPTSAEYQAWTAARFGISESVVRYTPPTEGIILGLSLHPALEKGGHSAGEMKLLLMLFEHLERSIRLARRSPDLEKGAEAVVVLDRSGLVVTASDQAWDILTSGDGLKVVNRALQAEKRSENQGLQQLVRSAAEALETGSAGGVARLSRSSGKPPLLIFVSPARSEQRVFTAQTLRVIVRIVDPAAPAERSAICRHAFGLTATEAELVEAFVAVDGNLKAAAERMTMLESTARVHMRNVFDKAGVRSQVSLMRLIERIMQATRTSYRLDR